MQALLLGGVSQLTCRVTLALANVTKHPMLPRIAKWFCYLAAKQKQWTTRRYSQGIRKRYAKRRTAGRQDMEEKEKQHHRKHLTWPSKQFITRQEFHNCSLWNNHMQLSADGGRQDASGCCFGATIANRSEESIFGSGGMSYNGNIPMNLPRLIL